MKSEAYQIDFSCGHKGLIGSRKPPKNAEFLCPEHGPVYVKNCTPGKIEPYIGFVPIQDNPKKEGDSKR
jgi:hypothetical protein